MIEVHDHQSAAVIALNFTQGLSGGYGNDAGVQTLNSPRNPGVGL